jgi:hypothetical protein
MSRLREEMKVIPGTAWLIAVLLYVAFGLLSWFIFIPRDPNLNQWPIWAMALSAVVIPSFLAIYVLLIGYVNRDARRRGMRHVMWTLLAIFIPNAIGIILYFIMRDPLLQPCPACGNIVSQGYAFCSKCGTALARACPECRSAVQQDWSYCTKCGAKLLKA